MDGQDFTALSRLGRALWAEPEKAASHAVETLAAVSLLDLSDERAIERTSKAMLLRASRDGASAAGPGVHRAFYRLGPEERLALSALHLARWSYARIGRVLEKTEAQVGELAWSARLYLVSAPGQATSVPHPTGSSPYGANCPDYNSRRPWTQSFLDDEISKTDRIFLQEHMLACPTCLQALNRSRAVYHAAGAIVPRGSSEDGTLGRLERAVRAAEINRDPLNQSFGEGLRVWLLRGETRAFLAVFFAVILFLAVRRLHG